MLNHLPVFLVPYPGFDYRYAIQVNRKDLAVEAAVVTVGDRQIKIDVWGKGYRWA